MDVLIFYGRLDYFDSLRDHWAFLDWLHSMNVYLRRYPLSETKKIKFAITKLTGQANQYWTDVVKRQVLSDQTPIETWDRMEEVLTDKY